MTEEIKIPDDLGDELERRNFAAALGHKLARKFPQLEQDVIAPALGLAAAQAFYVFLERIALDKQWYDHQIKIANEQLSRSEALGEMAVRGLESMSRAIGQRESVIRKLLGGKCIDHIDGNPNNWDLANLRVVTRSENLPKKRKQ
jgi:HNH endonuclease